MQPRAAVAPVLVDRQAHERLDAAQVEHALFEEVAIVERNLAYGLRCHDALRLPLTAQESTPTLWGC